MKNSNSLYCSPHILLVMMR